MFYKKRNFIWLLGVTMLLTACGGKSVINILVRDDSTKYPLSDVRISMKSDDKEKVVKSDREGKAVGKWGRKELPKNYNLPYTAQKEGYNPATGYFDVVPPLKPVYEIPMQKKAPKIKLDLQAKDKGEPGKEIECSAEIKNTGTADLTEAQLDLETPKDITFKGWNLGGGKRSYESRLPLEKIKPNDIKNYRFFVETSAPDTFEIIAILKSKELPEISKKLPIKPIPLLPELSLDLRENIVEKAIEIVLKNKGKGEAKALAVRISACCDSENKRKKILDKPLKNILPGEGEIVRCSIKEIKDEGILEGEVEITASISYGRGTISDKKIIYIPKPPPIQ